MSIASSPRAIGLALAACAILEGQLSAQEREATDCFDAEVSARIIAQIPSIPPTFEDGSVVMSWPWFVDLDVRRVHDGEASLGKMTVLSVQHTDWRSDLGFKRWRLRRNDQGSFNLLGLAQDSRQTRCGEDVAPARAYIDPGEGGTLDALRREGEARYGRRR